MHQLLDKETCYHTNCKRKVHLESNHGVGLCMTHYFRWLKKWNHNNGTIMTTPKPIDSSNSLLRMNEKWIREARERREQDRGFWSAKKLSLEIQGTGLTDYCQKLRQRAIEKLSTMGKEIPIDKTIQRDIIDNNIGQPVDLPGQNVKEDRSKNES